MTLEIIENSSKRRDRLVIMAEIIGLANKGISKTHIMFKANLSFSQLNQFLELLSNTALLEKISINGKVVYRATEKGLEFLGKQQEAIDLLKEDGQVYRNGLKTTFIFESLNAPKNFKNSIHKTPFRVY
jgi:predicted transcriptional regulator